MLGDDFILKTQFFQGTEHAVGFDSPKLAFFDFLASGQHAAVDGYRHPGLFKDIGSTGDDLGNLILPDVHVAHHQLVCIRVLFYSLDEADDHILDFFSKIFAGLQIGTGHDHPFTIFRFGHFYFGVIPKPLDRY